MDGTPIMLAPIAYLMADVAVRILPERTANTLARYLAQLAYALHVPARSRLERNLLALMRLRRLGAEHAPDERSARFSTLRRTSSWAEAADPERSDVRATALEAFEHFALSIVDFLRLARVPYDDLPRSIEVRGAEHLAAARASTRGVLVVSAHLGNWERGVAYLAARGTPVHVAARVHRSRWVEAFFARRRRRWGVKRLEGRPLWLAASRALRRREWVALMGDRAVPELGGSLCAWAAAVARRTGAILLPAVMLRLADGRYAACFEPPLSPEHCRNGGYRDAIRRHLERYPSQWSAFDLVPEGLA